MKNVGVRSIKAETAIYMCIYKPSVVNGISYAMKFVYLLVYLSSGAFYCCFQTQNVKRIYIVIHCFVRIISLLNDGDFMVPIDRMIVKQWTEMIIEESS